MIRNLRIGVSMISIAAILLYVAVEPGVSGEEAIVPAVATIYVNAAKIVKPVNKKLFGTSMERISREQWVRQLDLSDPKLRALLNELRPPFVTIDNTQLGLPFFSENTGKLSERVGIMKTLEKIGIENDETGRKLYSKLKADSYFNRNQPQHQNYDDILQFFETLDVKPDVSIRIPVIFTDQSEKLINLKLNLSPETGADLVHYLNDNETTALGKLRAQNGHPKPYNVKYFLLGNELWSNHDRAGLSAEQIILQYKGFSKSLKQADPSVKVGINLINDAYPHSFFKTGVAAKYAKRLSYNDTILKETGRQIDLVTFHVYGGMGEQDLANSLTEEQWRFVLAQGYLYEKYGMAARHKGITDKYIEKPLIAIDEYSGPLASFGGALYNADYLIYLMNNDYDFATNWHLGLMEPATKFGLIKVLEDKGVTSYIKRPNFYVLKMFTNYFGDSVVATTSTSPTFGTQGMNWAGYFNWPSENNIPAIKTVASIRGKELYLLIVNMDLKRDIKTKITINGFNPDPKAQVYVLNATDLNDTNETVYDNVVIRQSSFANTASSFEFMIEKHSVTVLKFSKEG